MGKAGRCRGVVASGVMAGFGIGGVFRLCLSSVQSTGVADAMLVRVNIAEDFSIWNRRRRNSVGIRS